ncbi:MAG: segregation/condensation protein A [Candidatus Micrarchaeota archaeon]|nr:segregation/condensation protein A [Candidatus Micrarchaeota archaeon]
MDSVASVTTYKELDLQDLVKNATWRELLMDLIDTHQIDPWDIDIVKIVDSYVAVVKKMRIMDLHVPANIILAASILLRFKSDSITIFDPVEAVEEEVPLEHQPRILPEVPALMPRARLQPGRKITLNELMDALNQAIKLNERRENVLREKFTPVELLVNKDDIDEKSTIVFQIIGKFTDTEGLANFTDVAKNFGTMDKVLLDLFVPMLFLAHKGQLTMIQEQFFGEIIIRVNDDPNGRDAG